MCVRSLPVRLSLICWCYCDTVNVLFLDTDFQSEKEKHRQDLRCAPRTSGYGLFVLCATLKIFPHRKPCLNNCQREWRRTNCTHLLIRPDIAYSWEHSLGMMPDTLYAQRKQRVHLCLRARDKWKREREREPETDCIMKSKNVKRWIVKNISIRNKTKQCIPYNTRNTFKT